MQGKTPWTDPDVVSALTTLGTYVTKGYFATDFAGQTWDAAAGEVLNGKAGMTVMGDWAKGYFQANDTKWADNFGWEPSPGTTGIFKVISDSFGLPKGAKNADNTKHFLQILLPRSARLRSTCARVPSLPAPTLIPASSTST